MSNYEHAERLKPDERREQIVSVAAVHVARYGTLGLSMSAVAKEAGVTRALVYHYFPGKEALLTAVLQREAAQLLAATAPAPGVSVQVNLERALHAYFDHFEAAKGGLRELYTAMTSTLPAARELVVANHLVQVDRMVEALEEPDTAELRLALSAWLAFVESTARQASEGRTWPRAQLLRLCVGSLAGALGRDPRSWLDERGPLSVAPREEKES